MNSGHHGASLGASRGFIDILNPFRFFNLESCIVIWQKFGKKMKEKTEDSQYLLARELVIFF